MNATIRYGTMLLATATDIVSGVRISEEVAVEAVRFLRRDAGEMRPRGGQLDSESFTVERVHATAVAAYKHLHDRKRELRKLRLTPGLTCEIRVTWATPFVCKYLHATVAAGESYQSGCRTFEPFTVTGALADSV